jgi:hypothetical protein
MAPSDKRADREGLVYSVALAILMKFDGTLMTLQVKEPCRDEGNDAAQNFSARLLLDLHLTFSTQVLSVS